MADDNAENAGGAVDGLASVPAGPQLMAALCAVDVDALGAHDAVAVIVGWERVARSVAAAQLAVMARLPEFEVYQRCRASGDPDLPHVHRPVEPAGDELSLALTVSPSRGKAMVVRAGELVHELPDALQALAEGRIDAQRAALVADRTRVLDDVETRRDVEAAVLPKAPAQTWRQLDRALRRAVIVADPLAAEARRAGAAADRRVEAPRPDTVDGSDAMARMQLVGPAEDLIALHTAVDAAARHQRHRGDPRTLAQLRFDTLTGVGWNALDLGHLGCCASTCVPPADKGTGQATSTGDSTASGTASGTTGGAGSATLLGRRHGRAASVTVTVAASSLFAADGQPGELTGFGPVTGSAVRRIAGYGVLRRMLTDPVGRPLSYAHTTYRPPPHLAEHVQARDVTCRFPTCDVTAAACDLDHRHPWNDGGPTDAENVWALHDGHHLGKTHHRFRAATDPTTGAIFWVTPAGHTYPIHADLAGQLPITGTDPPPDDPPLF